MGYSIVMCFSGMTIFGLLALPVYTYRANGEMGDSFWGAIGNILSGFFMIFVVGYLIHISTQAVF